MSEKLDKKLEDLSIWIEANRDVPPSTWENEVWPELKKNITQAFIDDGWIPSTEVEKWQKAVNTVANMAVDMHKRPTTIRVIPDGYMTREEWEKQAIADGWSPNIPAKNKSDMERILSVKREADIMDVRLLAISTPLYDDETPQTTQLGSTYGIDHVIGMVHQPMYYRLLDDKRGTMTAQEWYDRFEKVLADTPDTISVKADGKQHAYKRLVSRVHALSAARTAAGIDP